MTTQVVLGIDIGGTNVMYALVSKTGKICYESNAATANFPTSLSLVDYVYNQITSVLKSSNFELMGIGIGAPNGNIYTGTIEYAPNLVWKGIVPLAAQFEKAFNVKSILTNDANAAALGEMIFGNAKGLKHFIMITLGTGVGSGIVINGQLLYGHDGFAGELGHVIIETNGRTCGCGRQGCLEAYCSATGIVRTVAAWLAEGKPSSLALINNLSAKAIFDAALLGDALALQAFDFTAAHLGLALANAVAFSSPQAIFLFGGLANAGPLIIDATKKYMEQNLLAIYKNKVAILPSALPPNQAALLGAASLIWQ
jgi:glucokinase